MQKRIAVALVQSRDGMSPIAAFFNPQDADRALEGYKVKKLVCDITLYESYEEYQRSQTTQERHKFTVVKNAPFSWLNLMRQRFDISATIISSSPDHDWAILKLGGIKENIDKAIEWARQEGIIVEPS